MKSILLYFVFIFSLHLAPQAQDVASLIKEAEKLELVPNEIGALLKYKEALKIQYTNLQALTKASELCSRIGKRQTNIKSQEDFYVAAKLYAEAALKVSPTNSEANCVMAMSLGHLSMSKSNKEKIHTAKDLKKYIDLSLKDNPNNYKAWHVLGRWHYEISNLNVFEKAAVKILFGGLPPASIKQSIAAFEKAHAITKTGFVLNCLELARAYKKNGDKDKAIKILEYMLTMPNHTEDDPALKVIGKKLLSELK